MKLKFSNLNNWFKSLSFRKKLLLLFVVPIFVFSTLIATIYTYLSISLFKKEVAIISYEFTSIISDFITEHLKKHELNTIKEHVKHIRLKKITNLIVLDTNKNLIAFTNFPSETYLKEINSLLDSNSSDKKRMKITLSHMIIALPLQKEGKVIGHLVIIKKRSIKKIIICFILLTLLFILIFGIFLIYISSYITNYVNISFNKINEALTNIQKGIFKFSITTSSKDEFATIIKNLKKTAEILENTLIKKSYYQELLNLFKEGILLIDKNGTIKELNTVAKNLLSNLSEKKEISNNLNLKDLVPPIWECIKGYLTSNSITNNLSRTIKFIHKNKVIWLEVYLVPHQKDYLLIIKDITQLMKEKKKLIKKAQKDPFTNFFNKESFWRYFNRLIEKSKTSNEEISLVVFDIDNFKQINDTYGHDFGDKILLKICDVLRKCFRKSDFIARYGGDEFCVVLRNVSKDIAFKLANRVHEEISKLIIKDPDGRDLKVGISFGVSTFPEDEIDPEELFKIADKRMYSQKKQKT